MPPHHPQTPDHAGSVNDSILNPRLTAIRERLDDLTRGAHQLAEKLSCENGDLFAHEQACASTEAFGFLIVGEEKSNSETLLEDLLRHNPGKGELPQKHGALIDAFSIHSLSTHHQKTFTKAVQKSDIVFFEIPSHSLDTIPWDILANLRLQDLEKLILLVGHHADSSSITFIEALASQKLDRKVPVFHASSRNDQGLSALRDCVTAKLLEAGAWQRKVIAAIETGEQTLRKIEDQIENLNRKIRHQAQFLSDIERELSTMRGSFSARLPRHIEMLASVFDLETMAAAKTLKKRLGPFASVARLFTGGRVGIQMQSVFTQRILNAVMDIAAQDSDDIIANCMEHHRQLCAKTKDELGSACSLKMDANTMLIQARQHFLERAENASKRSTADLKFRNSLEKMLRRRNTSLKSFVAVALALTFIGATFGALGIQWLGIVLCSLAALFGIGGLWAAWFSRRSIVSDFNQRLAEARDTFTTNFHSEYEAAIGSLLAEYASCIRPIRMYIDQEKNTILPLARRWQELFLGFRAIAQEL